MSKQVVASLYGGPMLSDVQFRTERYGEKDVFVKNHLGRIQKGSINTIVVPAESLREAELFVREVHDSEGKLTLVTTPEGVRRAHEAGSTACILGASYSTIGGSLDTLNLLYQLGARLFTMAGNHRNIFVDGCGERDQGGLSHLGVKLVQRMEKLGIIIDVSHTSAKGISDILDVTSDAVVVASHSDTRQICDSPRNLADDQIKAIAKRGGMVGLSMHPTLVKDEDSSLEDVVDHIAAIIAMTSDDHIGIGTDFVDYAEDVFVHKMQAIDPTGALYGGILHSYPTNVESIEKISNIFDLMEKRGFSQSTINKVKGDNFMRILAAVQK